MHPGWRLLTAHHAPLVASFLHRAFIVPNLRAISAADLAEQLEDQLFALRQREGRDDAYPKTAASYLDDWAHPDNGWLRKFYSAGSDLPTLMEHRALWTTEPVQKTAELRNLTPDEQALYDELRFNRLGTGVRLEQERVSYGWAMQRLQEAMQPS